MKIATIGLGYVGLVTAACFSELGHDVLGIDISEEKINALENGKLPIYEQGLHDLVFKNHKEGRLKFRRRFTEEIDSVDLIFIAVGTPTGSDGKQDISAVYKSLDAIIPLVKTPKIFVLKSTVQIGTNTQIRNYLSEKLKVEFDVVNNPEFLKEGTAVNDFMKPDRIVIGTNSVKSGEIMKELYSHFTRNGHPIYVMDPVSAETVKYVSNTMLALKVSFINEIARLCDATGADIRRVREGFTSDPRIGNQFFYPSIGYGGSCFPKDVQELVQSIDETGLNLLIPRAIQDANENQIQWFLNKMFAFYEKEDLTSKTLAVWGTSFKSNTDDVRESPAIKIIQGLVEKGIKLKVYDPVALENAEKVLKEKGLKENITYCTNEKETLEGVDGLVVCTEWLQFRNPDFEELAEKLKDKVVFDGRNLYDPEKLKLYGLSHIGVGIQPSILNQNVSA